MSVSPSLTTFSLVVDTKLKALLTRFPKLYIMLNLIN
nr:MAG TPA: hypothetical protein [Caudoviricetes sp.]